MDQSRPPRLTYRVHLAGGQQRLREAALYVMKKCQHADFFGMTKLNKILWKADFSAYAGRQTPVTGRQYQRLKNGPAPVEMLPVLQDLQSADFVRIETKEMGPYLERRPIALVEPSMRFFSADDLTYLDAAIDLYWNFSGSGVSEDSHGVAWKTRKNGDPMPYELALLSDDELSAYEAEYFSGLGKERGWVSH